MTDGTAGLAHPRPPVTITVYGQPAPAGPGPPPREDSHMAQYRKKPVVIEAWQWTPGDLAAAGEITGILMASGTDFSCPGGMGETTTLAIATLEGEMLARPGDWIIRGVQGEFYPCKDEIFRATYDPA
jgi:hypothetical protein